MLYVSHVDGELTKNEEEGIRLFCRKIGLTDAQFGQMLAEAITRVEQGEITATCPSCSSTIKGNAKFCPNCGAAISQAEAESEKLTFEIPRFKKR